MSGSEHERRSFPAMSRTRMAGSASARRSTASYKPDDASMDAAEDGEAGWPAVAAPSPGASQILCKMRRRLRRVRALLEESFCKSREKRSGWARDSARAGERRRSFWSGSRRFSKALARAVVKHCTMAEAKLLLKRCSSTLAVSSWSLFRS